MDGRLIYFGKAKFEEAGRAGVEDDARIGVFRIDRIHLPDASG